MKKEEIEKLQSIVDKEIDENEELDINGSGVVIDILNTMDSLYDLEELVKMFKRCGVDVDYDKINEGEDEGKFVELQNEFVICVMKSWIKSLEAK